MKELVYHPSALDNLKVDVTATATADPNYFLFKKWCQKTVEQKKSTLLNKQDLTGVMYLHTDFEFRSVSIISASPNRFEQDKWLVGQLGNRLSRSPESIQFNHVNICSSIVVPMREPYAKELGLLYDKSIIISVDNCKFWPEVNKPTVVTHILVKKL